MHRWLGVDVGGPRKGFDVALIDERKVLALANRLKCEQVVEFVKSTGPSVVAIDSPRCCALDGQKTRECELRLNKEVCGIRWTPDKAQVDAIPYYSWIVEGLTLYDALAKSDVEVIEVFPTASWTRWFGRRGNQSRATWSRKGLDAHGLEGVLARTNQDQRDAIAAGVTARDHAYGLAEAMGEIVVPVAQR